MAATRKIPTKITPYWQIGIIFPDGKKLTKLRCDDNEMYSTYFLNLDKYLNKDFDAEQLLNLYKKNYKDKNIKVVIHYMDSWGHLWKGKYAWPKEEWFIEYLNKRMSAK